ncbi:hypothetical protein V8Z74_19695 [Comamonas sp. w2-DMI]|uniref:hypothetical protein n=1 Tax=Comamonas sp. w2-DMI TaxID=3126391 RepID=UPI0032E45052
MKAVYTTVVNPTLAATIADIAALLCGADIADLSANCVKDSSSVDKTIPAGWTLVDAAASATDRVISAPDVDGLTQKYLRLGGSATFLSVMGYESWNAANHTGVNATNGGTALGTTASVKFAANAVQQYYVMATPRYAVVIDGSAPTGYMGCFEFSRMAQWLKGSSYPCFAVSNTGQNGLMSASSNSLCSPRVKSQTAAGDLTGLGATAVTPGSLAAACVRPRYTAAGSATTPASPALDAQDQPFHNLTPIWVGQRIDAFSSSPLGVFLDVAEITNMGASADTLLDASGSKWHVVLPATTFASGAMALRFA